MPRKLSQEKSWHHLQISPQELQPGDLLFLKHKKSHRLITHVAMALGPEKIFHCSSEKKGAAIEKIEEVFHLYSQASNLQAMLAYIDPRTRA